MGGVVGSLACLFCKSGCQASSVASALAFFPPSPPFYDIQYDEESKSYVLELSIDPAMLNGYRVSVDIIPTKVGSTIPVITFIVDDANYTIIYSHGNATDCGAMFLRYAEMATKLGVNIVAYDYTGYGVSRGKPSDKQTYKDIDTIYEWCCQHMVSDASRELILLGQSVGSGPSCYLASTARVAGLILISPITSGLRVLTSSRLLACFDIYPNIDRIAKVKCPVFIVHGDEDNEVHCSHGRDLQDAVPRKYQTDPWWVEKRGHNDLTEGNEEEFYRRLSQFINKLPIS